MRAVSHSVSALLLVLVAVAAVSLVYMYVHELAPGRGSPMGPAGLSIEAARLEPSGLCTLYVRSYVERPLRLTAAYLIEPSEGEVVAYAPLNATIPPKSVAEVHVRFRGVRPGAAYVVQLTTEDGRVAAYPVRA